jgi:tRNA pseudouridine55 synthase
VPAASGTADGLLLVDKPAGLTSHDVVNAARRALGERRIGHAGTLDPFATGLLVLLVGRATRLLPHLPGEPKVYEATVRFGAETETEDLHGAVTREAGLPARRALLDALPALTGAIDQVPPAYSAKRVEGKRAYALARAGEAPQLPPVRVRVDRWEVLALDDDVAVREARVRVTCGGGTYVRSLARDWARLAGSAAHLTALRRIRSGGFDVADALPVAALESAAAGPSGVGPVPADRTGPRGRSGLLRPALDALLGFPRQALTEEDVTRVARGIDVAATVAGAWGALVHPAHGALVALAERRGDRWQPRVVMHAVPGAEPAA